ncbi:hypothetical protein KP509_27G000600 [Ceratopteris richardii]|uniref:B box-type domain-containing protein n=1 Tax=Ceratopteris richardii TaxID=49495 RepID=A0A8T2RFR5_CERRI|nr:hypothetical protein KP509_27G000600 [Ceratopteris richardii]KAH7294438.1 hypothetical protein KP509_27G000600 [Ceratopteris richardii]KAH7294439.1 hypothetical protein KP509_27G000600 [Ceratopteris richardii]
MKIQCDVCDKAPATLICCDDEAALCGDCDSRIHAANKLAGKHERVALLRGSARRGQQIGDSDFTSPPNCDICQETQGLFFCLEDRAVLCRRCDLSIHISNNLTRRHKRFLLATIRVGLDAMPCPPFAYHVSPSNGHSSLSDLAPLLHRSSSEASNTTVQHISPSTLTLPALSPSSSHSLSMFVHSTKPLPQFPISSLPISSTVGISLMDSPQFLSHSPLNSSSSTVLDVSNLPQILPPPNALNSSADIQNEGEHEESINVKEDTCHAARIVPSLQRHFLDTNARFMLDSEKIEGTSLHRVSQPHHSFSSSITHTNHHFEHHNSSMQFLNDLTEPDTVLNDSSTRSAFNAISTPMNAMHVDWAVLNNAFMTDILHPNMSSDRVSFAEVPSPQRPSDQHHPSSGHSHTSKRKRCLNEAFYTTLDNLVVPDPILPYFGKNRD